MKLLLIRHAQSQNNVIEDRPDYAQARQPDPPLTAHGHASARQFAQDADLGSVTHLYTSLMLRAVQTAAPIAARLNLPAHGLELAYEYGDLTTGPAGGFTPVTGSDHATLRTHCPALLWPAHLHGQPWHGGAEPWQEPLFHARATQVLTDLRARHPGQDRVALITHHDFAGALIRAALGWPATDTPPTFHLAHLGTALLDLPDGGGVGGLLWLNR
ncbi:histidine phosphatase family protein [Deinococcus aquaticus]|uniref:Histidine phosphatase family protein n=1 Tax=Deinococcus aquaticus TaxID=328692 RepID=A0ABY7V038_9DEIO|nr:histidine phosphatase family protein [Deinococcus aquaticus]WDA58531.1 histidine phosphatase family protein [Deinococcus aquaticus]